MQKSLLAITLASLFTPVSHLHANEVQRQETLVVTANRFAQVESSVLSSVTVVSRQEIEDYQAHSLIEVLRRVPGIEIAQNGGRGHNASIFMRGTNSDHVLVLVDGIRVNSSAGGVAINRFPTSLVERLEVIRGPNAARYGSDAIGGVINIITRSHRGDEAKQVALGVGSLGSKKADVIAKADIQDKGHLQMAAGFDQTDGYDIKNPGNGTQYGYEGQNLMAGYEHQFNDQWLGYASASWFDSDAEYDDYGSVKHGYSQNESFTGQLNYQGEQLKSLVSVNYQQTENLDFTQAEGKANASTKANISMTQLQWANLYQLTPYAEIGAGVDARRESLAADAKNYGNAHKLAGESLDTRGVFASGRVFVGDWTFDSSLRYDKHDKYDHYTTWSLAAGYQLNAAHRLRAAYGTAFKAPTYSDLTTSPDLKPEESKNLELGVSGVYSFASWNASVYDNKVDNLIIWYKPALSSGSWYSDNTDARIKGLELDVSFNTGPVHHTLVAEFKDHQDDNHVQLARRAKQNYKWISSLNLGQFDLNATYTYTGKRLDLPTAAPTSDDYISATNLWDMSIGYWVNDDLTLRGRVENVFNEQYESALGYKAPERAYFFNVTYQF